MVHELTFYLVHFYNLPYFVAKNAANMQYQYGHIGSFNTFSSKVELVSTGFDGFVV